MQTGHSLTGSSRRIEDEETDGPSQREDGPEPDRRSPAVIVIVATVMAVIVIMRVIV